MQDGRPPANRVVTGAKPVFITAALLAATGAAAWLPESEGPGLFILMVAALSVVSLFGAGAIPKDPWSFAFVALALALSAMAALRSSAWFVVPGALLAAGLVVLSVSAARSWLGLLLSALNPVAQLRKVPKFIFQSTGAADRANLEGTFRAIRTGVVAAILLIIFGALFASADRAFAEIVEQALPDWDLGLIPARLIIFALGLTALSAVAITGLRRDGSPDGEPKVTVTKVRFAEWFVPLLLLVLLFATFVGVQFTVLFGGHDLVLRTAGLTYSEYAREGFFQLLLASALSLGVVCGATIWSSTDTPRSRSILKVMLGAICVLTLVILVSALKRLGLYEEAFGYTRVRLAGHVAALWLAGIFAMTMVGGALSTTRWLPRSAIGFTAVAMLIFGAINPENLIAKENLDRAQQTGRLDAGYLYELGPDAIDTFAALPATSQLRGCVLSRQAERLEEEAWSDFNWARHRARKLLRAQGSPGSLPDGRCPSEMSAS